jgi:hypothetical protein
MPETKRKQKDITKLAPSFPNYVRRAAFCRLYNSRLSTPQDAKRTVWTPLDYYESTPIILDSRMHDPAINVILRRFSTLNTDQRRALDEVIAAEFFHVFSDETRTKCYQQFKLLRRAWDRARNMLVCLLYDQQFSVLCIGGTVA